MKKNKKHFLMMLEQIAIDNNTSVTKVKEEMLIAIKASLNSGNKEAEEMRPFLERKNDDEMLEAFVIMLASKVETSVKKERYTN